MYLAICLIALSCLEGAIFVIGVKILRHSIPRFVDLRNTSELILDCEYTYDVNDLMLVVKWYHNKMPETIYQWIPERKTRYISPMLEPRFDKNYSVSPNDEYSKFRALKIKNVTVDLNGNFSCFVSSMAGQDSRLGQMIVYASPHSFDFNFTELSKPGDYELLCHAKDVYPRPQLTLSAQTTQGSNFNILPNVNVTSEQNQATLFYDATLKHIPRISPESGAIFECKLEIPQTNYVKRKRILIFPNESQSRVTSGQQLCSSNLFLQLAFVLSFMFVAIVLDF